MDLLKTIFMLANLLNLVSCDCHFDFNQPICPCRIDEASESNSMKECTDWCSPPSAVSYKVLDRKKGKACISFTIPPANCNHTRYEVELMAKEGTGTCSHLALHTGLVEIKAVSNGCPGKCQNMIEIDFYYLFTGCYQLTIQPYTENGTRQKCFSKKFFIETDYKKELVGLDTPEFTALTMEKKVSTTADFGSVFPSGYVPETVDITLESDQKKSTCELNTMNNTSHEDINKDQCACKWKNTVLECDFYDIPPGNYEILLTADDLRCREYSVWSPGFDHPMCRWKIDYTVNYVKTNHVALPEKKSPNKDYIILSTAVFSVFLVILLFIIWKKTKLSSYIKGVCTHQNTEYYPVSQVPQIKVINSRLKVLLLYPRDCQPFMETMKAFRNILMQTSNLEVYDMWDEERYDEVAAVVSRWGLSLLNDSESKIILVANSCSRLFEEYLVQSSSAKRQLSYQQPDPFDGIFVNLLDNFIRFNDPYNKIFVVRLESEDFQKNVFKFISTCRAFTIPSQISCLLTSIFGENPTTTILNINEDEEMFQKLRNCIAELSSFVEKNPNYLDELLKTNDITNKL